MSVCVCACVCLACRWRLRTQVKDAIWRACALSSLTIVPHTYGLCARSRRSPASTTPSMGVKKKLNKYHIQLLLLQYYIIFIIRLPCYSSVLCSNASMLMEFVHLSSARVSPGACFRTCEHAMCEVCAHCAANNMCWFWRCSHAVHK